MIKIEIVDDHEIILKGLESLLSDSLEVLAGYQNQNSFLKELGLLNIES